MAAVTIKEQPAGYGYVFGKSPILYSIISTDFAFDDFEYICDVYLWQGDITVTPASYSYRLRKPRNSVTGSSTVNVSTLVGDYFLNMPITFSTPDDVEEMSVNLLIKFGYSYTDGSGVYQEFLNLATSTAVKCFNGYTLYSDGINYQAVNYFGASSFSLLMTNKPLTSYVPNDTNLFMSLINTGVTAEKLRFIINGSETVYTDYSALDEGLLVFGVGVPQLPAHTTNDDDITYYTVATVNSSNTQVSKEYTFRIFEPCKYGYINLQFLNRFGQWDNMIFRGAVNEGFEAEKMEAMYSPLSIDASSEFQFDEYKGQFHTITKTGRETKQINTGWIDEDWNPVIKQLLMSPQVFDADTLEPVTITTSSLAMQSNLNDKLINYSLEIKKAFTYVNTVD